jgi:diacylglycerol kinase (ATP)
MTISKHSNDNHDEVNPQKRRSGLSRIWHAMGYSIEGLKAGWHETAFRQELLAALVLIPASFWVGRNWLETSVLIAVVVIVMITELLNTAVEKAIDRVGFERHELSKASKDFGSAAVLLAILLCAGVWLAAIYHRFFV